MKLSIKKYALVYFVSAEALYYPYLEYGRILSPRGRDLHHAIIELLPFVVWGNIGSMIRGGICLGLFSGLVGAYIAWVHNYSLGK